MSSILNDTTVNGRVTQTQAATQPNHLIRLAEAMTLLSSLFPGAWNSTTTFTAGQMTTSGGSLYIANQTTLNQSPASNPSVWTVAAAGGTNGSSAFPYVAYASDTSGTGFSLTPGSGLIYVAFLMSAVVITSPTAANFTGLWQQYTGATGATGAAGTNGAAGASVYGYIGYASDTSGTGFSLTPSSGLNFVAFLLSNVVIGSPSAANFTGLWKNYSNNFTVTSPITFTTGVLALNAASANTASYLVQRDASGNFTAGTISATSVVVGSTTLAYASGLTINTAVNITAGALTLNGLSGVLQATTGVVSGSATSNSLPEDGSVNVATASGNAYFSRARVLATPLTGVSSTNSILATDTILAAFGKLDALTVLTGYTSGAGTVLASDTQLTAIQKLNGNQVVTATAVAALNLINPTFTGVVTLTPAVVTSGSPNILVLTGAVNTTLAGGVESSDVVFNFNRTVQFNTGALALQRALRVEAPTYSFVGASTLAIAASVGISGPPIAGTNATVTLAAALKIYSGATGSGTTTACGLYVDAPTGASNNYAAVFNTGDVLVNAGWLRAATSYGLKVNAVQVVTGRQTGWTAATGTATRTSFATSSVTLANLAQAVKAVIDDLITHGLIGT
jgi:hypothetical protein